MYGRQTFGKKAKLFRLCLIVLCGLVASWLPVQTSVVHAQPPVTDEYGYLWKLEFSFDKDFDGVLTMEVGPWQNGNLVKVEETSVTIVRCAPIGKVVLENSAATFGGGSYLECSFNIGEIVQNNHGLQPNNPDTYGSIVMRTRASLAAEGIAPIFHHPDAQYRLNPAAGQLIEFTTDLSNEKGPMSANFSNVNWNTWQTYTSDYICHLHGPCRLEYAAGGSTALLTEQGKHVTFETQETTFYIGRDDTNFLNGSIDSLLVDPGNSAH